MRVKKKLELSENLDNQKSALEKRKKLLQKSNDENLREDVNLKSVFKDKGIGLSVNDNRKNYNPFEGISENDEEESGFESLIKEREEIEKANDKVEEKEELVVDRKLETKTNVIGLSDLISSLKNLGSKNSLEGI